MNNTKKQVDFLKVFIFLKTSIFLVLIFLGISTKLVSSPWLLIVFVSLFLILILTQIFSVLSISDTYTSQNKITARI